jgi:TolB protein
MRLLAPCSGLVFAGAILALSATTGAAAELGAFTDQGDVGDVAKAGSVEFDAASGSYTLTGGGENMWFTNDAFHFVWKKMSGDVKLTAAIRWVGASTQPHRKACLILRQSLDPDSAYVDAVLHGNGLTSLQYRETPGGNTREIQSNVSGPVALSIEKRGDDFYLFIAARGAALQPAGASFRLPLQDPFYAGLAVCSHDNSNLETAVFSDVDLAALPAAPPTAGLKVESTLEIVPVASLDRRVIYHTADHIEAPNWSRDGQFFIFNSGGRLFKLPVNGGQPQAIDTASALKCNNDHGLSPDGRQLAISDQSEPDNKSRIYVLPIGGGKPRQVTADGPSYWHGWSPDGRTLAYCAQRDREFDIYTIPIEGGAERRLTTAAGLDDGPDYSPDGKYIYFNSDRTGLMQIWRMKTDGSNQEQVTRDDCNNWFPHPSPDGRWIVFLSYSKEVRGHPANKDVMLRLMPTRAGQVQVLAKLFGGQGTINVPSWSPDSQRVAFVSYQPVYP